MNQQKKRGCFLAESFAKRIAECFAIILMMLLLLIVSETQKNNVAHLEENYSENAVKSGRTSGITKKLEEYMRLPDIAKTDVPKVGSAPTEVVEEVSETSTETSTETSLEEATEITAQEPEPWMEYTEEDVKMLGKLMFAEEGSLLSKIDYNYAMRAHLLAGSVVLHRIKCEKHFSNDMYGVIFLDNKAYASETKRKINDPSFVVPDEVYAWAEDLLRNGPVGPETLVFQAQFTQGEGIYEHIDNQYFCLIAE